VNEMGLLDRIDEEESVEETPVEKPKQEKEKKPRRSRRSKAAKSEDTPVATAEKPRKNPKKSKKPRDRVDRSLTGDFEKAGMAAFSFRRLIDFIANIGWSVPILGLTMFGTNSDFTWFLLGGMCITVLNTIVLPVQFGRTLGNFTTRTAFVRHTGKQPFAGFHLLKAMFLPFIVAGLFGLQMAVSYSDDTNIVLLIICMVCLLIVIAEIVIGRIRKGDRQGLWESVFLGVYLVKHVSSGESSGWLKRLESSGDFFESKGWGVDKEGEESDES
tara:strand:+ start:11992 stop:12807 length:816 start_codon:yes stop_codon:yes gene_type:complete